MGSQNIIENADIIDLIRTDTLQQNDGWIWL